MTSCMPEHLGVPPAGQAGDEGAARRSTRAMPTSRTSNSYPFPPRSEGPICDRRRLGPGRTWHNRPGQAGRLLFDLFFEPVPPAPAARAAVPDVRIVTDISTPSAKHDGGMRWTP